MIDEQGKRRERESKILGPLFCHGIRMETKEVYIYRDCFRIRKGEGRFVGVSRRMKRGCNDASDELKLVKGGLMRVYEERKNDLSLYFNRFIV